MADIIQYNPVGTPPGRVIDYRQSVHTPDYEGLPNTLINPDLTAVAGVSVRHWKVVDGAVVPMTAEDQSALSGADSAANVQRRREAVQSLFDDEGMVILERGRTQALVNALNAIRGQIGMNNLTLNQALNGVRNAVQAEINNIS